MSTNDIPYLPFFQETAKNSSERDQREIRSIKTNLNEVQVNILWISLCYFLLLKILVL